MQVGDLVQKSVNLAQPLDKQTTLLGIVVAVEASDLGSTHAKICWGDYGTFWQGISVLEVLSESR